MALTWDSKNKSCAIPFLPNESAETGLANSHFGSKFLSVLSCQNANFAIKPNSTKGFNFTPPLLLSLRLNSSLSDFLFLKCCSPRTFLIIESTLTFLAKKEMAIKRPWILHIWSHNNDNSKTTISLCPTTGEEGQKEG